MRNAVIALLVTIGCLSAHGQFFSKEETATLTKGADVLKTAIPEAEQKEVYIQLCEAESKANHKAVNLFHVKIQHTPEQRIEQKKRPKTANKLSLPDTKSIWPRKTRLRRNA